MADFTTSDGISIHYSDIGSGQPLLCLAGLTRCERDFSHLAPHVTDLRMITMDYRGRGQSEYDPDYMNYNVMREGQDAIELLDHLGLERVTLLGTSRGGLIAMTLAATQPQRLSGVILNDVGPVVSAEGIARIMDYVGKPTVSQTYDQAAQAMHTTLAPQFPDVPLAVWRQQVEVQFDESPDGLTLRYDPKLRDALIEQAAAGPVPDLWPLFEALKPLPTGVIRGENSDILEPGTLTEMQTRHPEMLTAVIPNRGHVPFLDEPQSLSLIRSILERAL
ncbi:alpha/beta hydrolase [Tropicibacter sp. R16_0]|uniref:alpha/beta fold hydrolase n=1 Tax=Tropicibacter sp. R16_0 TaxID=2821102 RepID=UPI001ADD54B0|nr:alpha/beta hydrolase [Tropicibacter sp. R16_0]MBO9448753.1 alpha/beta hydrolase [Tropicibacter sp. R16_0]